MSTSFFVGEGNLGSVPNLKQVPSSQSQTGNVSVLEFSTRINVDRKNKQSGQFEDTLGFWVDVSYWGKSAEAIAPLLQKGAHVLLVGELGMESWISNQPDTQGQQRQLQKLRAEHVAILPWGVEQVIYRARTSTGSQPQTNAQQATPAQQQAAPQPMAVPAGVATSHPQGVASPAPQAAAQPAAPQHVQDYMGQGGDT